MVDFFLAKASQPEPVVTPTPPEVVTTVAEVTTTTVTSTNAQTPNTGKLRFIWNIL